MTDPTTPIGFQHGGCLSCPVVYTSAPRDTASRTRHQSWLQPRQPANLTAAGTLLHVQRTSSCTTTVAGETLGGNIPEHSIARPSFSPSTSNDIPKHCGKSRIETECQMLIKKQDDRPPRRHRMLVAPAGAARGDVNGHRVVRHSFC